MAPPFGTSSTLPYMIVKLILQKARGDSSRCAAELGQGHSILGGTHKGVGGISCHGICFFEQVARSPPWFIFEQLDAVVEVVLFLYSFKSPPRRPALTALHL